MPIERCFEKEGEEKHDNIYGVKSMTNGALKHATCISRVQASILAIYRLISSGGDQHLQMQSVKRKIQKNPGRLVRARTDHSSYGNLYSKITSKKRKLISGELAGGRRVLTDGQNASS
jgi:hypothetical protein